MDDFETLRQALRTGYINADEHNALARIEARVRELEAENENYEIGNQQLEAEVERLREALERIDLYPEHTDEQGTVGRELRAIARRALATPEQSHPPRT